jgi:hypothetical protein
MFRGLAARLRSMDRDAAVDAGPDSVEVDVGERTAAVVEEALPTDWVGAGGDVGSGAEFVQCPYGVGR